MSQSAFAIARASLLTSLQKTLGEDNDAEIRHHSRQRFSPSLSYGRHFGPPSPTAKQAAVMILIEERGGEWSIPLTERPQHLPDHPGQISLPGGRLELDETHIDAAIREFNEELGTLTFPGHVVGALSPVYVYNSDYYVVPFIAISNGPNNYVPCEHEVARVIHLPVSRLLENGKYVEQVFHRGRTQWTSRTIQCEDVQVWGATAIMLGECARVLEVAIGSK